jgi:hypothetical protein
MAHKLKNCAQKPAVLILKQAFLLAIPWAAADIISGQLLMIVCWVGAGF